MATNPKSLKDNAMTIETRTALVERPTMARIDSFVDGMAQKRLTYADLIAKPEGN